jgi:hypothetical protein
MLTRSGVVAAVNTVDIADWPIGKWSLVNAASCMVSLNRHGPAAKPGRVDILAGL